jgi:hypothetical protein
MNSEATCSRSHIAMAVTMKIIGRIRGLLYLWVSTWTRTLVGELIALSQPRSDFRR